MKRFIATTLLALRMRPSLAFALRQLRGSAGVSEYTVRATGRRILIRHDSDDPFVLEECFGRLAQYEPPPEAARALERNPPLKVVDLGANVGLFGLLALDRFPGSNVTGLEPDPQNAELHERCIVANGLGDRWQLVRAYAACAAGKVSFGAGRSSRSRAAQEGEAAIEVEAVDAFSYLAGADLVRIDIEGAEWELLADPRFLSIEATVIVLEYHGFKCPSEDPHEAAVNALERAGFETAISSRNPSPKDEYEGYGTVWAWRGPVVLK